METQETQALKSAQAKTRQQAERRRAAILAERQKDWDNHWCELSEFVLPRAGRFLTSDTNRGNRRNGKIIDSTATRAARTLAAGMMSGITSPARPWFRLRAANADMMADADVKAWLYDVERRMRDIFDGSNIYNVLQAMYAEVGVFGTAACFLLEDDETIVRAVPLTIGEYGLAQSARLTIDTLTRSMQLTVAQLVEMFGYDAVSENVQSLWDQGKLDEWVEVAHLVEPNRQSDDTPSLTDKPFRSVYWEVASASDRVLRVSGFDSFPVLAPRWDVTATDIYGRSPGMDALGDVKQLQIQERRKAQAIDKKITPPMKASTQLRNKQASLLPGGVTYVDSVAGAVGFEPVHEVNLSIAELAADMEETRQRIWSTFYADLFLMISSSSRRQITAREIDERHEEKLLGLGPVLERLNDELLNPMIDRVFAIMVRRGLVPPPPELLAGQPLQVDFTSSLAQAQKAIATQSIERFTGFVGTLASINPAVLDKVDFDLAVEQYGEMVGVPPRIVKSEKDVEATRQEQAQAAQAAQATALMQQGAATAKDLAGVDPEKSPLVKSALEQLGGANG